VPLSDFLGSDFWTAESRRLLAVLLPLIQEGAELGVEIAEGDLWDEFQIGFDNALANEAAASWARMHTDDLLEMLGTTTQRVVGAQIANYIETPGMTQGDLAAALEKVLGTNRQRALMIGRTESTRATAAGRDEGRVAAGLPVTLFKPPLHPRGRCGDAAELLDDGTWVVTWQTRRDEIVCTAEYDVPWGTGTVRGCRGMHGRVISEGPYFGMLIERARAIAAEQAEEQVTAEQASAKLAAALGGYTAWQAGRSAPVKFDPRQPRDEGGRWTATGVISPYDVGMLALDARGRVLLAAEREFIIQNYETAVAVNADGEIVLHKDGEKSKVYFTKSEMTKLENCSLTHNHPTGCSFSEEDLSFAIRTGLAEMHAVGFQGAKRYRYIWRPTQKIEGEKWAIFNRVAKQVNSELYRRSHEAMRLGEMSVAEFNAQHNHTLWQTINDRLIAEYNIDIGYSREEW